MRHKTTHHRDCSFSSNFPALRLSRRLHRQTPASLAGPGGWLRRLRHRLRRLRLRRAEQVLEEEVIVIRKWLLRVRCRLGGLLALVDRPFCPGSR